MSKSINLIPQQELNIQKEKKFLNLTTIFSVILLLIFLIVSIVILNFKYNTNQKINELDKNISSLRESINTESKIEIVARNLDSKYNTLSFILNSRPYYSDLLQELYARKPDNILILDVGLRGNNIIELNGNSDVYLIVAEFTKNITSTEFSGGDENLKNLFTNVSLNSVNLESSGAYFSLSITFNPSVLNKKINGLSEKL